MCTPAIRALGRRFPGATITVAGRSVICDLLEGLPYIHRLQQIPARAGLRPMCRLAVELRPWARDLAVIFPHSFRAALLAWLARARTRVGYTRGGRSWLLNGRLAPHREGGRITPVYMAREYLALAELLGGMDDGQGLELHADTTAMDEVRSWMEGPGPIIGVAPGAAFGPSKCWPAERYARVMNALSDQVGARFVLLTGPGEERVRAEILEQTCATVLDGASRSTGLVRLKAIMAQIDLFIGNDSGPRHIAIAFKKPVICIMGPTSPRYTDSPWERGRVLRIDVDCGPCQQPVCSTDHRCMTGIAVEDVVRAACEYLPAGQTR